MVQVNQDHVVPVGSQSVIEDDGPQPSCVGMLEAFEALRPAPREGRQMEHRAAQTLTGRIRPNACQGGLAKRRLTSQIKRDLDDSLDILCGQPKLSLRFIELLVKLLDLLSEPPLERQHPPNRLRLPLGGLGLQAVSAAEHRLLHLGRDDRPNRAKVVSDPLNLDGGQHQELEIALEHARRERRLLTTLAVALAHEVIDQYPGGSLAVTVDTAVALLHPVRVPWDLVVDQA